MLGICSISPNRQSLDDGRDKGISRIICRVGFTDLRPHPVAMDTLSSYLTERSTDEPVHIRAVTG